jgi:hypothetical protein
MFTFFLRITQGSDALWHRGNFTGDIPVIIQLVICNQKLVIALQYLTPVIIHQFASGVSWNSFHKILTKKVCIIK